MRAAYLTRHGEADVIEVGELPTPEPGPGEVRVRVRMAALNHLDIWVRRGLPGLKLAYPHVLGGDAAGHVDKLGPGVASVKVGDEVIVHPGLCPAGSEAGLDGWESLDPRYRILGEHVSGTHAEYVVVPAENVFAKPNGLDFAGAASLPLVFTTAWQMLVRRAKIRPGDRVVIHAAGSGVGSAGVQIARLHGAEVIATAGSDEKLALAKKLGAHHVINYATSDFAKEVRKYAPQGADVIFDHLGRDHWEKNIKCVRSGGTLVVCGATSGHDAVTDLRHVFYRQISILGSTMGTKADFPRILRHVEKGELVPVLDRTFPLALAQDAHRRLELRAQFGKVILSA